MTEGLQLTPVEYTSPYLYLIHEDERPSEQEKPSYEEITAALVQARNEILHSDDIAAGAGKKTFNIEFYQHVYRKLSEFHDLTSEAYLMARDELDAATMKDLETLLGEAFHVDISRFSYQIRGNELFPEYGGRESMLDVMKRGRDFRRIHGNPIDWPREDAEVEGFAFITNLMTDENTPVGTMVFSKSRPGNKEEGSIYSQDFMDGQIKTEEGTNVIRFRTSLSTEEFVQKLHQYSDQLTEGVIPTTEELLHQPIVIRPGDSPFETLEEVQEYLQKEHGYLKEEELDEVQKIVLPLKLALINALAEEPWNSPLHKLIVNAILNKSQLAVKNIERRNAGKLYEVISAPTTAYALSEDILTLGNQEVVGIDTDCGFLDGYDTDGSSPSSVADFGREAPDQHGSLYFRCPSCTLMNKRDRGILRPTCQHCGSKDVACDGPSPAELVKKRKEKEQQKEEERLAEQHEREEEYAFQQKKKSEPIPIFFGKNKRN